VKSPQQLFNSSCSGCHRSPQGLAKASGASGLTSFLRQHYTSGQPSAAALAGYLASVGGRDPRASRRRGEPEPTGPALETRTRRAEDTAVGPNGRSERQRGQAERKATRAERAARAETEQRRAGEPRGLSWTRAAPWRARGEPATVSTDPVPIVILASPTPVTPRVAAREQIGATPAPAPSPTLSASPATPPAAATTAALPAAPIAAPDAVVPAITEPSERAPSPPSALAAAPEAAAVPADLPNYPPRLDLELRGGIDSSAETSTAAAPANQPNGAQPTFSAPLP